MLSTQIKSIEHYTKPESLHSFCIHSVYLLMIHNFYRNDRQATITPAMSKQTRIHYVCIHSSHSAFLKASFPYIRFLLSI